MTTQTKPHADELAALFPEPTVVRIGTRDVLVREVGVAKIARFAELLAPAFARFPNLAGDDDIYPVMLAAGPAMIEGIAHAVDMPVEWVGALPAGEFARLVGAVQAANRDFFASAAGRVVSGAVATLLIRVLVTESANGDGPKSSTLSSLEDTERSTTSAA